MELIITEKPSAAKMIASALSDSTPNQVKNGKVSYYELTHNKKKLL
jgi:DNA topoisomerase IA